MYKTKRYVILVNSYICRSIDGVKLSTLLATLSANKRSMGTHLYMYSNTHKKQQNRAVQKATYSYTFKTFWVGISKKWLNLALTPFFTYACTTRWLKNLKYTVYNKSRNTSMSHWCECKERNFWVLREKESENSLEILIFIFFGVCYCIGITCWP